MFFGDTIHNILWERTGLFSMNPSVRTDLALESRELAGNSPEEQARIPGVRFSKETRRGIRVDCMDITSPEGASVLCKPMGRYITAEIDRFLHRQDDAFRDTAMALGDLLRELLSLPAEGSVLIACLGNPSITPDAIGPLCARATMVTRHLKERMPETFQSFRTVSLVCPGVLGTTGIESAALVGATVREIHPDAVIAVDALAARNLHRLCRTVQICNTGIAPGSGVGNARSALNQESLGVPVIAVGVPTVVDAAALVQELTGAAPADTPEPQMIVTPREIDSFVADAAKLVGYGINLALHDGLTVEDVDLFIS